MDEHPNPRNRADPELILSTLLPESSAAASATRNVTTNTASPFEPFRSASDPRNLARYSKKNTVLLCDWWLLLAPEVHEGRRLSVGGVVADRYRGSCQHEGDRSGSKFLLSPWQKAERVFESAPITKRYDSVTLGTADGITVRIRGVINKACSHQNDIPLKFCNSFLIGFPFNWDKYAGACFEGKLNSASVPESAASPNELSEGFADAEGRLFPVHLDDFSLSRILDGSVDGSVTSKFRDFLNRFCYTTKPLASDVHNCTLPLVESCLPHEPPSKHERATVLAPGTEGLEHVARFDKLSCSSSRDHQNILVEGLDPTPPWKKIAEKEKYEKERIRQKHVNGSNHVGEGYVVGPPEAAGCYRDGLQGDEVDGGNFMTAHVENNVSLDSSLYVTSQVNTLPIKVADVQKISLESIPEIDNGIRLATPIRVSMGTVDVISNCAGEANSESSSSLADGYLKGSCTQKGTLLENLTTEKAIHKPRSDPVSLDMKDSIYCMPNCIEDANSESFECSADLGIESGLVRNVSDMKDTNSLIPLEISRKPVIAISPKASDSKEKVCRRSSRFASATKLQINPAPTSDTKGGGLTDVQISVYTGHENEFLKFTNANTTQSDTIMGIHTSKEKILDLSINTIQNNQSKRGRKKKQSPLSVSNFTHASSATKLQINPPPTSDTEGGGLTDEQISVNTGHESEFLKSTNANTTQSGKQIDPASTSDTEGGGLIDVQISVNTGHEREFLNSTNANTTQSDTIMGFHSSKEKMLDLSINKIQNNQSKRGRKKKQSPPSVCRAYKKGRSLHSSGRAFWRLSYVNQYPLTRDTANKLCIASPESLNLKRSRSGRLLVPRIAHWCQKIIYAANGEITAITGEGLRNFPWIERESEPPRKRKRLV